MACSGGPGGSATGPATCSSRRSCSRFLAGRASIGIHPSYLHRVFERFWQADGSSTRIHSGLGLGLALVRHIVEVHGGEVEARSEGEGRGSTFLIRLPGRPQEPRQEVAASGG